MEIRYDRASGALSSPLQLSHEESAALAAATARGDFVAARAIVARARTRRSDAETTLAHGSAPAPSAVGTDERAVMRAFRERLARAWRDE